MNISGKMYPKVEIECMKVPDFGREVRLNGATIQVLAREAPKGESKHDATMASLSEAELLDDKHS